MVEKARNRERSIQKLIYISEEENQKIKQNMKKIGSVNFSDYARKCLTNQKIYAVDFTEIREMTVAISTAKTDLQKIGNNINQIAKSLNTTEQNMTKELIENYQNQLEDLNKNIRKTLADIVKGK